MTTRDDIRTYRCSSVEQFLQQVASAISQQPNDNQGTVLLWRGHANIAWGLEPSLQRQWKGNSEGLVGAEKSMFEEFQRAAPFLMPSIISHDWDRLSIAQHYGMQTRLLDWTVNHMVALWFALSGPSEHDAAVWSFRPLKANLADRRTFRESPFSITKTTVFRPTAHSPRVSMQAGWHTAHKFKPGKGLLALDRISTHLPHLSLFRIPKDSRDQMLADLESTGITVTTVFGDLPSLCLDITNRHRPKSTAKA